MSEEEIQFEQESQVENVTIANEVKKDNSTWYVWFYITLSKLSSKNKHTITYH